VRLFYDLNTSKNTDVDVGEYINCPGRYVPVPMINLGSPMFTFIVGDVERNGSVV
jgi:hypothetical protein